MWDKRVGKHEGTQSSAAGLPLSQDWEGTVLKQNVFYVGSHCCSFSVPRVLHLGGGAGAAGICQPAGEITAVKLACVPANAALAFIHTASATLYCAKCFMK